MLVFFIFLRKGLLQSLLRLDGQGYRWPSLTEVEFLGACPRLPSPQDVICVMHKTTKLSFFSSIQYLKLREEMFKPEKSFWSGFNMQ